MSGPSGRCRACAEFRVAQGLGMLEFVVALAIFATVVVAVLSAQLTGKQLQHEALQRTVALALGEEILHRLQANPGRVADYLVEEFGDALNPLPEPDVDCRASTCSATELAEFDLWQWQQLLLGAEAVHGAEFVGGLGQTRACVRAQSRQIRVAIVWRAAVPAPQLHSDGCGSTAGLYDAAGAPPGNNLLRRQLLLDSYLPGGL